MTDDALLSFNVPAFGYQIWLTPNDTDWTTPATPTFAATEANGSVTLAITGDGTATEYTVYRSLVDGGYAQIAEIPAEAGQVTFADPDLTNGTTYYYKVAALSPTGLTSALSASQPATPHVTVSAVTVADPTVMQHTLSAIEPSPETQGTVSVPGVTDEPGQAPGVLMQVGWAPAGTTDFAWIDGAYVTDNQGGADIYAARMLPETTGDFVYRWRASTTGGRDWTESSNEGKLTVYANADTEAPKPPFRLDEVARSASQIAIGIRISRLPDLYELRVCRADLTAGEERLRHADQHPGRFQQLHGQPGYQRPHLCLHDAYGRQCLQRLGALARAYPDRRIGAGGRYLARLGARGHPGR